MKRIPMNLLYINLQDLMLLLQVVFPLSQPGQRLPCLLQATLPAHQVSLTRIDHNRRKEGMDGKFENRVFHLASQ